MSPLERRSRLLLRIYPADYRRERGGKMIGTLLETTPDDRAWPRLRDVRALAVGGLRARAAQNSRLSTAANLRVAVMAGVSLYLILIAAEDLGNWVIDPGPLRYEWRLMAVGLLVVGAVLPAWLSPRVIAALSGLAAVVAIYFVGRNDVPSWPWISLVVCVAAIVLLAPRSARPPRKWRGFFGAFAAAVAWVILASRYGWASTHLQATPVVAFGGVSVAWLVIDAGLAVAVCHLCADVLRRALGALLQGWNASGPARCRCDRGAGSLGAAASVSAA